MRRRSSFLGLGLLLFAAPLFAQTPPLEHFQCYAVKTATPPMIIPLELRDQFTVPGTAVDQVEASRVVKFCNPAGKFHRNQFFPVADDRQHLTFFATYPQSEPVRVVVLSNQFDRTAAQPQTWIIEDAVALAVPTHKPPHNPPVGLDHYRCYRAHGTAAITPEVVGLIDEFLPFSGRAVLHPSLFCNPVVKKRLDTGDVTPILNPNVHMACYATTRVAFATSRDIETQFGRQTLLVGPPDTLCVPTRKLNFVQIPDSPIGGITPQ